MNTLRDFTILTTRTNLGMTEMTAFMGSHIFIQVPWVSYCPCHGALTIRVTFEVKYRATGVLSFLPTARSHFLRLRLRCRLPRYMKSVVLFLSTSTRIFSVE